MDKLVKWLEDLIRAQKKSRAWRTFVSCLAAIVVFTTTYSLILPAITVESTATEDVGGLVMEGTDAGSTGAQAEAPGEVVTVDAENEVPEEPVQEEAPVVETEPAEETSAEETAAETPASSSETGTAQPAASQPQTAETAESAAAVTEEVRELVNGEVQTIGDKRVMTLKGDDFDVVVSGDLSVGVSDRTVLSVRGIADAEVAKSYSDRIADELLKIFVDTKTTEVLYQLVFTDENLVEYTPAGHFDVQFIFHKNTISHTGEKIYAAIYDYLTDEMVLAEKNSDEYETPVISLDEYGIIKGITLKDMHFDRYSDIITLVAGPVNEELKNAVKTITSKGKDYTVKVSYGTDAKIPDDAKLEVKEIENDTEAYKEYLEQARAAMGLSSDEELSAEQARFFDITITSGGAEVQPAANVNVSIQYDKPVVETHKAESADVSANVVHFTEEDTSFVETNTESTQSVEFTAESFSVYGVIYTVDFEYTDEEGTKFTWSWDGNDSYAVADIMAQLGVTDKILDASLKRTVDAGGPDNALYLEKRDNGWYLVSETAFDDTFELTVKTDSKTYVITVTDDSNDSTNFRDSVREVTADGLSGDSWTVRSDIDYKINLTFAESAGNVQFPDSDTLSYQLPSGFKPTGALQDVAFDLTYTDSGVAHTLEGCKYDMDQNGNITIHLTDAAKDIITRAGDAKIKIEIRGRFDSNAKQLDFGGGVVKNVTVKDNHNVTIEKSGDFKTDDGKVHYKLTVKSEGENNNVKVTDTITGSALQLDSGSVIIKNAKGETVPLQVNSSGNTFDFTIPKMGHNDTYTVEYTASVNWDALGDGTGTVDQTKNKATVKSNEDPDPDEKEIDLKNKIDYNPLVKAHGEVPKGDSDVKTIPWTITINDKFIRNMKNAKITDRIESSDVMKYSGEWITIDKFDQSGKKVGSVKKTWKELNVDPETDTTWTYTIPDDGKFKYVISYTTDVNVSKQNAMLQVKNTVGDDKWHTSQGTADVEPGSSAIKVDKKFESASIEDMNWSVTVTVPATGLNKAVMTDDLPAKDHSGKKYKDLLDKDSISVEGLVDGEDYIVTPSDGKFVITFYKDKDHTEPGLKKTADSGTRDIKVTFKTLTDKDWVKDSRNDAHRNNVSFQGDNGIVTDYDEGTVPKKYLDKVFIESKEFYVGDVKLLAYKYSIDLWGVSDSDFTNGQLTVTDKYPSNYLELWDLNTKSSTPDGKHNGWWDQTIQNGYNGGDGAEGSGAGNNNKFVISPSGGELSFVFKNTGDRAADKNVLPRNKDGTYFDRYQVTYYLVVKNAETMEQMLRDSLSKENRTIELKNTAKWGTFEDYATVDYGYEALTKTNVKPSTMGEGGNEVYDPNTGKTGFTIDINPGELTLNGGEDMTLTDTFSDSLSIDYSSIKIYEISSSGERTLRKDIQYDYKGNVGTYTIPDGKHFLITYDAKLVGKPGQNVHYENKVEMSGFSDKAGGDKQISGGGEASANIYSVMLYKYEAGHMEKPIPGTIFTMVDESGNPMTYPNYAADTEKRGKPITFTTEDDGYVKIELSERDDGISLQKGVTYYLKETKPSPGYSANNITYRFTISDNPDYDNYEYHSGDILKVYDSPVKGQIEIEKTITGASNLTAEDKQKITFTITGTYPDGKTIKADEEGIPVEEVKATDEMADFNLQISYADFTGGKFLMQDLVLGDYVVKETNAALENYASVTTTYELDGTEQAGKEVRVTIKDTNKHSIKVTNTYEGKKPGIDINIKKINKNGEVITKLYGAKFKLEIFDENINDFTAVTEGSVAEDGTFSIPYENAETGVTLTSLKSGRYRITEIQAPENYQIVGDGTFEFQVNGEDVTYTDNEYASYTPADKTFTVNNESDHSYKFTKVDGTSVSIKLPGAQFGVFKHTTDAADKAVKAEDAIKVYTTNSEGRFDIRLSDADYDSEGTTIYFVKEIKPPEGYKLPESPKLYYFFFGSATTTDGTGRLDAVNLRDRSGRETVTNDLKQIEVEKKWLKYSTGEEPDISDIESIEFALYQTKIVTDVSTGEEISREEKQYPDSATTFAVTKNGHWKTTINDLPAYGAREGSKAITYTYRVEELNLGDKFEMTFKSENDGRKLVMENTPKSTWIKAEKKWIGVPPGRTKGVTLKLQRKPIDGSSGWSDVANMNKQLNESTGWEVTWDKLPENYYYRVREVSMQDQQFYTVVYSSNNGEEGTLGGEKVTISNIFTDTPNGKIAVQKVWQDSNGNQLAPKDIPSGFTLNGEIWRKVYTKDGYKVTVNLLHTGNDPSNPFKTKYGDYYVQRSGGSVNFAVNQYGDSGTASIGGTEQRVEKGTVFSVNVTGDVVINILSESPWNDVRFDSVEVINEAPAELTGDTKWNDFTLNSSPWKIQYDEEPVENGYAEYYIKNVSESDESYKLEYYNNDGIQTGCIVLTNTFTRATGNLNVKKTTRVNGAADSSGLLDGTYSFTIKGAAGTDTADFEKTIQLTVAKGVTTGVSPQIVDEAMNVTAAVNDGIVTISKLPTGTYTVTENLTEEQKAAGISLLGKNGIELEVTKNNNSNIPTAEFVNNLPTTKAVIKGTKEVKGGGSDLQGYTFTLSRDDEKAPLPDNKTATSKSDGTFEFAEITYPSSVLDEVEVQEESGTKTKEFTYKVVENLPQGSDPATDEEKTAGYAVRDGVKYDITPKEVKVTVSLDTKTGIMRASVSPDQTGVKVVNEQLTDFTFYKVWYGKESDVVDWPDAARIKVTVKRTPGNDFSYTYIVGKDDFTSAWKEIESTTSEGPALKVKLGSGTEKYTFYMDNLEKENAEGQAYSYSVTEAEKVDGYKDPAYGYKNGEKITTKSGEDGKSASDKQYIVNTPEDAVALPSTGGPGTGLFYGAGIAFLAAAGLLLFVRRRRIRNLSEGRW